MIRSTDPIWQSKGYYKE
jgi:hypothetical protein